jgi:hypothetical protein
MSVLLLLEKLLSAGTLAGLVRPANVSFHSTEHVNANSSLKRGRRILTKQLCEM